MDLDLFLHILKIPSTSGEERLLAERLRELLPFGGCLVQSHEVGDGTVNLQWVLGDGLDGMGAYLCQRGLRTLSLRME